MMTWNELCGPSPKPWRPHAFQKKAVKFLLEHACAALFLDPGLGKTSVVLKALQVLKQQGLARRTLVIAPLRVCYRVWPDEQQLWTDFHGLRLVVLHGPDKETALTADADIYVINPEGLEWLVKDGRLRRLRCDTLVVDELSKFKHTRTKRFKLLKPWLRTFRRRWGLTGSPAANGLLDLFGQAYLLDLGHALGPYITHYRHQYFYPTGFGSYTWTLQAGASERIYERLAPLVLRMATEDYLELPQLVENNIRVDLPAEARKIYDQLEQLLVAQIKDDLVVAANAAALSTKCRQLANGGLYLSGPEDQPTPAKREWRLVHTAKVDALADLVDELQGQPLLVAYDFDHDLDRIKQRLGDVPHIGGGVSPKRFMELTQLWNDGQLPVLLAHPQAVAHGLNLQSVGRHVCWFALTWNYELYDQLIRRIWRQGSRAHQVVVHHIIARDTIDDVVLWTVRRKRRVQQNLFEALRSWAAKK